MKEISHTVEATISIVDTWVSVHKDLGGGDDPGDVPGITPGMRVEGALWAAKVTPHFDRGEARMVELMAAGPDASADIQAALRRAYVLFYDATGRLNREVARRKEQVEPDEVAKEVTAAYHELEQCIEALSGAIDPELRGR